VSAVDGAGEGGFSLGDEAAAPAGGEGLGGAVFATAAVHEEGKEVKA